MAPRDYSNAPVSETLNLQSVILGLASDLTALRDGAISPPDALARAALAKQVFNGVRLYLQAITTLERGAKEAAHLPSPDTGERTDA